MAGMSTHRISQIEIGIEIETPVPLRAFQPRKLMKHPPHAPMIFPLKRKKTAPIRQSPAHR